jgi:dihydrolipoamide dehydrogenase
VIAELGPAISSELTYDEISATIHAHPTLSEAIFEAVHAAHGTAINL